MEVLESVTVTAFDQLGNLYAPPSERVLRKEIDHVDAAGRAFIAASPFLVLATGSSQGLDCSPKGDKPGFVEVEDDGLTLLIPDRRGNSDCAIFAAPAMRKGFPEGLGEVGVNITACCEISISNGTRRRSATMLSMPKFCRSSPRKMSLSA
jgi:hypothetical protein